MASKMFSFLLLISLNCSLINALHRLKITNSSFDTSLYENAIDAKECHRQLSYIRSDSKLRLQFLDAGMRIPKFITQGNNLDMGYYHGCLGIHQAVDDSTIQGKYCMISVPANQEMTLPVLSELARYSKLLREIKKERTSVMMSNISKSVIKNSSTPINLRLAVCIPKSCTISESLKEFLNSSMPGGFQFKEEFCRLPNDKPWVPADYITILLFSVIGIVTVISTLYDLRNQFILRKDPKSVNPLCTSFSVYTNARHLTTFNKNPNNLECMDGVRALSMTCIIIYHIFEYTPQYFNVNDYRKWKLSLHSIWTTSAPLAVDIFLMMSGMLLVYTKAGKWTGPKLIRNLHLFYLNRILRMFPLLAAGILMQASFFHWISDGPLWQVMAYEADCCRNYWWLNLLYVNNFFTPKCLGVSWYLGFDMQLHILSPILLYFVLSGSKRQAWAALGGGVFAILTASTVYVFLQQLPGSLLQPGRIRENQDYGYLYYYNTLPRAPPFFVGMMFGYILHLNRQHKLKLSKTTVLLVWCLVIVTGASSLYSPEPMKDVNYYNQTVDSLVNAFARSGWAFAVAMLIVLCINGYGGPVNWFLSLRCWKLISRLSYAMYLHHISIILLINGTYLQPVHFSVTATLYGFCSIFSITFIVGFFATLMIDSPFSTIFNHLLSGGDKKFQKEAPNTYTLRHEP